MSTRSQAAGPLSSLTRTGILNNGGVVNFAANVSVDVPFTVPGVEAGQFVKAFNQSGAALASGLVIGQARITDPALDTVTVRVGNVTTGAINGVALTLDFEITDPSLLLG
jgi:hypothetical protein